MIRTSGSVPPAPTVIPSPKSSITCKSYCVPTVRLKGPSVIILASAYGSPAQAEAGDHASAQVSQGFPPFAISHTPQAFPFGVRLQKVSSP